MKLSVLFPGLFLLVAAGCGGPKFVDTAHLPNTYQCNYMNDVCKEAKDYEATYEKMSPEEKKEFKNVLDAYKSQCNDALKSCLESGK